MRKKVKTLYDWRNTFEKTPSQMARFLNIPHTTYLRLESGNIPTFQTALKVADGLGIDSLRALKGLFMPSDVHNMNIKEVNK